MANLLFGLYNLIRNKKFSIFLIIGVQKAGTTALHNYLSQHPSIRSPTTKEIHFFNSDLRYSKGIDYYHSKFPLTDDGSLFIDASGGYLISNIAYKRIYKYNPKIKMIVLLRDPVDRAYSAWNMYRSRYLKNRNWFFDDWVSFAGGTSEEYIKRNDEEILNFELFVRNELNNLLLMPHKCTEAPILVHGLYEEHLSRFLSLFRREQLLVLESTYLREHTSMALEKITSFLSIQKFDLDLINLSPIFVGNYTDTLSQVAASELSSFYAPHNEALYKLLGTRFNWK
jgi:hypothetical protein